VLERCHALLRQQVPAMPTDRYLGPDIEVAAGLVSAGALSPMLRGLANLSALWVAA
jgi:histidine ammonia-lyase